MVEPKQHKPATSFDAIGTAGDLRDKGVEPDQAAAMAKGMNDASSAAVVDAVNIFQTAMEKQAGKIDKIDSKIDVLREETGNKIDGLREETGSKIDVLREETGRKISDAKVYIVSIIVTATGVILAAIRFMPQL